MDGNITDLDFLHEIFLEETGKYIIKTDALTAAIVIKNLMGNEDINELFRLIHSIKGAASMMGYMNIAEVAHAIEDLFFYLRENKCDSSAVVPMLHLSAEGMGFIKNEMNKIREGDDEEASCYPVISKIKKYLKSINDCENEIVIQGENEFNSSDYSFIKNKLKEKENSKYSFLTLYPKVNRIAKIMSTEFDKSIELEMHGLETQVDYDVYEKISNAVMHMVKNSIDHGIEKKEIRVLKGKSEKGTITIEIKKYLEEVYVQVSDDGVGLNVSEIMDKIKERGLLKKDPSEYSDGEIFRFILRPGFTTRQKATMFSGRGVGLDAVNASISALGGYILIDSEKDRGCSFIIKIPLK